MRDFPSCFGENGVQVADSSSSSTTKAAQNIVTCIYHSKLRSHSCFITLTWTKTLMGQGLSITINDSSSHCSCKLDIKPWLFSKRKGYKDLELDSTQIDVHWDLASAKFGPGPEPLSSFYLAIVLDQQIMLLLGDMKKEAHKKIGSTLAPSNCAFISKREHIFGKRIYSAKARFSEKGKIYDVMIECDTLNRNNPCLVISIGGETVMCVKRVRWKFRGNHRISVDGVHVGVFWDVHDWLFGNGLGCAVFMFQSCVSEEKLWSCTNSIFDPSLVTFGDSQVQSLGFSLILHAWKSE